MPQSDNAIAAAVADIAKVAVRDAIKDPGTPLHSELPRMAARDVAETVEAKVAPVVAHLTNNEPWYQSRVALGSIGTMVTSAFGLYGLWAAGIHEGDLYAPLIAAEFGAAFALYGRFIATKPLGA